MYITLSVNTLNLPHAGKVEYVHGDFYNLYKITQQYEYSASRFLNGQRKNTHFIGSSLIILDFDENLSLEAGIEHFKDVISLCVTTKSHNISKNGKISDRFRVILPLESSIINMEYYGSLMRSITRHYNSDIACSDPARFYSPNKEQIVFYSNANKYFDLSPFHNNTEPERFTFQCIENDKLFAHPSTRIDLVHLLEEEVIFYMHGMKQSKPLKEIIKSSTISDKAIPCHCFLNPSHADVHPSCFIFINHNSIFAKCSACHAEGILFTPNRGTIDAI